MSVESQCSFEFFLVHLVAYHMIKCMQISVFFIRKHYESIYLWGRLSVTCWCSHVKTFVSKIIKDKCKHINNKNTIFIHYATIFFHERIRNIHPIEKNIVLKCKCVMIKIQNVSKLYLTARFLIIHILSMKLYKKNETAEEKKRWLKYFEVFNHKQRQQKQSELNVHLAPITWVLL